MSRSRLAVSIEFSCSVHATEEEERVLRALINLLPEELRSVSDLPMTKHVTHGFYGNPILLIRVIYGEQEADKIALHIFSSMPSKDTQSVLQDFQSRFAKGRLYLRFDKQEAYRGSIKLSSGDEVIKCVIKLKPNIRRSEDLERVLKEQGVRL
ncbi:RNA-binding domain-containing protein [Infirmifilum sp. SLHALR2]|nr:MAG: hypothetical protein B7L53_08515 [Thermofilum sp. NZ13]